MNLGFSRRLTTAGLIQCFTDILDSVFKQTVWGYHEYNIIISSCDWLVCRSTHLSILGLQSQLVPADGLDVSGLGQNLDPFRSLHQEGSCGRLQPAKPQPQQPQQQRYQRQGKSLLATRATEDHRGRNDTFSTFQQQPRENPTAVVTVMLFVD